MLCFLLTGIVILKQDFFDKGIIHIVALSLFVCLCAYLTLNSLPNETFLDYSKLKALAKDKINVTQKLKFVME